MTVKTMTTRLLLIAGAVVALGAGFAYAAIPGAQGVINGCYEKRTGLLRVIDAEAGKKCTYWETPITWSQQYLAGEGLTLTGNVFSVADGSLKAADFSTVDEEGLTSDNIKNESLTGEDLDTGSVATADVADESLTGEDLDTGSVATSDVANESLTGDDIDTGSVATSDIANESLTGDDIDTGSVATSDIENESLTGTDLANGSVATKDLKANAVTNAVDLDFELRGPRLGLPELEPVVSASINLPTGGESGPPQADHKVLVTGQALVECSARCTQPDDLATIAWQLREPGATESSQQPATVLGPVYRARLLTGNTFIASVSHVLTRSDPGFNEHTIDFVMWIPGPASPFHSPPPETRVRVTQASLSLIDLGSV
jgi:hypothetical protein